MKPAKCHPEKPAVAKGMCMTCYGYWRYHNVPEYRAARIASASRRQAKRKRKPRPYRATQWIDIPRQWEGIQRTEAYRSILYWTAQEKANLDACLKRRGLWRPLTAMGGWRKAA